MAFLDFLFGKNEKPTNNEPLFNVNDLFGENQRFTPQDFKDFFLGKSSETVTKPIHTPQQQELLDFILSQMQQQGPQGFQNIQNILGGDEDTFAAFERPARRAFEQQTLPTIAQRFTSQLGEGSQRSSGFQQAKATAGRELEENLMAKRLGLQSGAMDQLMRYLGAATGPVQHEYVRPRQKGFLEDLAAAAASGVGGTIGGGIPGAVAGGMSGLMNLIGKGKKPSFSQEQEGLTGNDYIYRT